MFVILGLMLLSTASVYCRHQSLNSGLAVIRDKVSPEEMSEMILNPRKRDLSSISTGQNEIEAAKIQTIIDEQKQQKETMHEREVRAVQLITTRLKKKPDEELDLSPDHFVKKNRMRRVVITQGSRKPSRFPAAFVNAVARIVVPVRPEDKEMDDIGDGTPALIRLSTAK